MIHEDLTHLQRLIALSLANEYGLRGKEALDLASACAAEAGGAPRAAAPSGPDAGDSGSGRATRLRRHENVELVHNAISIALMRRSVRLGGSVAVEELAEDLCLELQRAVGGIVGFYLPRPVSTEQRRQHRNDRIRRMAGPGPHTVKAAKKIAREVGCSFSTVWRALSEVNS